jgi:hypothetical protein
MALAKFSKFKKERAAIKEARNKEVKTKKFNELFSETLKELGLKSVADLSEEQMNAFLSALKTKKLNEGEEINEDKAEEIEAHVMAMGEPKPAGQAGDVNKEHGFDSPQNPENAAEASAEDLKADKNDQIEVEVDNGDVTVEESTEETAEEAVEEGSMMEADEIKSDKEFEDYAMDVLKKAHPDDFDEGIAKKVVSGLKDKYGDDYGAMVGALTSGFGG